MYPQNCTKPLEYHCLLNPYANESLEVCAPNTWLAEGQYDLECWELPCRIVLIDDNIKTPGLFDGNLKYKPL